jgi:thioesterase domain-containing protein
LENHFNAYAFQAVGILDNGKLPETREEIIDEYIYEMKLVQPEGPYLLAGHCFGGLIGYEMVRALEKRKDTIEKFIIFDNSALVAEFLMDHPIVTKYYYTKYRYNLISKRVLQNLKNRFKIISGSRNNVIKQENDKDESNALPEDLAARRLEVQLNYKRLFNNALLFTGIIHAPILVLKAYEPDAPWNPRWHPRVMAKQSTKTVEVIEIPGGHFSIFNPPYVSELARAMIEKL